MAKKQKKQPQSLVSRVKGKVIKALGLGPRELSPEIKKMLDENDEELGRAFSGIGTIVGNVEQPVKPHIPAILPEPIQAESIEKPTGKTRAVETPRTGFARVKVIDSNPGDSYESLLRGTNKDLSAWNQIPETQATMRILMAGSIKPESGSDPLKDAIAFEKVYQALESEFPEESHEIQETSHEYQRITQEGIDIPGETIDSLRGKIREVIDAEHPELGEVEKEYITRSAAVKIYNENPSSEELAGAVIDITEEEIDNLGNSIYDLNKKIELKEKQRFRRKVGGLTAAVLAAGLVLAGTVGGMSYLLGKSNSQNTPSSYSVETRNKTNKLEENVTGLRQDVNKQSQEIQEVKETLQGNEEEGTPGLVQNVQAVQETLQGNEEEGTPGLVQNVQAVQETITEYGEKAKTAIEKVAETMRQEYQETQAATQNQITAVQNNVQAVKEDVQELSEKVNARDAILAAEGPEPGENEGYSNPLGAQRNVEQPLYTPTNQRNIAPEKESEWKLGLGTYAGAKFALNSKGDKPDTMPVFGVEARLNRRNANRLGLYGALEFGQMDDSESTSTSRAELDSSTYTGRIGLDYRVVDSDKVKLIAGFGGRVTRENNDGYLELATQTGTERMDINDSNTLFGLEANFGVEARLNDRFSIEAGATYGHNFDSDNVDDDMKATFKFNVKF